MEQEYWVDSEPPARKRPVQRGADQRAEYQSRISPWFALFIGIPTLLFLLFIQAVSDALAGSFMGAFWKTVHPWLVVACSIILVICAAILAWQMYLLWHRVMLQHYERKARRQQLQLAAEAHADALARENERLEIEREKGASDREIALEKIRLEQMRATLEHERLMAAQRALVLSAGQTVIFPEEGYRRIEGQPAPAALNGRGQAKELAQRAESRLEDMEELQPKEDEKPIPVPVAPAFWDIAHLITTEKMPLCFVVDDDPESPYYGETVPQFGTIDDLLSLCVIGKPGRGKTVLLMYYVLMLAVYGAETHIFDPHGVMAELALLHGRELVGMPATARIYYYDRKETMEEAVKALSREMVDRDELYRPHLEDGELVNHKVKHPLLVLADELSILADFDDQLRAAYKERNRELPVEKREQVPSLMYLIRRTVLEARKWRMFFIGSSQSIDATILPTKVTDALNSRIVFFNSDRKARMVGLEADVIKKLLPVIRRAGPGMTIYDCARWDMPKIGAIPNVTIEIMLEFLGIDLASLTASWIAEQGRNGMPLNRVVEQAEDETGDARNGREKVTEVDFTSRQIVRAGFPQNGVSEPVESVPAQPETSQFVPQGDDKMLPGDRMDDLVYWYGKVGSVRGALEKMGITNSRYVRHASFLLEQRGLKSRRA